MAMSQAPSLSTQAQEFGDHELVINFHDAVIYGSDLKLLERRKQWLNDSCIHFFFTFLQQRTGLRDNSQHGTPSFLFMDPSVISFWMHQCVDRDEIDDFLCNTSFPCRMKKDEKEFTKRGVIFIAVNDNMSTRLSPYSNAWQTPNSGNHWSLLVMEVCSVEIDRSQQNYSSAETDSSESTCGCDGANSRRNEEILVRCWHLDSVPKSGNIRAAEDIAAKICCHVYPMAKDELSMDHPRGDVIASKRQRRPTVRMIETPQQQNGYDCGVHVLGAAKILSHYYATSESNNDHTCRRLLPLERQRKQLEQQLQTEIDLSKDFCASLRLEIASEIRYLRSHEQKHR